MKLKVWQIYLAIPFLLWAGINSYYDLKTWEDSGGTKSMNRLLWLIYDMGGKSLVAALFLATGALFAWVLLQSRKYDRLLHEQALAHQARSKRRHA